MQLLVGVSAIIVIGGAGWLFLARDKHVAAGRQVYVSYCSPCHGAKGRGDGYNAKNLDPTPRDLTDREESYMGGLTNAQIVEAIEKGGRGIEITPLMPAFGRVFSEEEIYSLTAYIRTLHPYKGEPVQVTPALKRTRPVFPAVQETEFTALYDAEVKGKKAEQELVEEGEKLFGDYGCPGCHRVGDHGGELGPHLTRAGFMLQPQYIYRWIRNPQAFKRQTRMPNLGLSEREALAVALYVSTLQGEGQQPEGDVR